MAVLRFLMVFYPISHWHGIGMAWHGTHSRLFFSYFLIIRIKNKVNFFSFEKKAFLRPSTSTIHTHEEDENKRLNYFFFNSVSSSVVILCDVVSSSFLSVWLTKAYTQQSNSPNNWTAKYSKIVFLVMLHNNSPHHHCYYFVTEGDIQTTLVGVCNDNVYPHDMMPNAKHCIAYHDMMMMTTMTMTWLL